ncbi:Stk1 family PASTA domain-containing Ser/Thr kinase [Kroppenstedtia pulmonis]|uniref:Serine/threonine-protein kinase PrkC n=1 Tax=Kroppenstedtia pulmonis TaxID=1380685 RepID=A0A7D3XPJ9_9BACL|nr:Stk1 family PASTA domain-containing Ser/Thr kinase [Kroppenstedtia pulmonis]QKG83522.1 Stk1 family PASTA domain-containing Ser/Thr kinase [Kroppenstedtia pulmonis]
MEGKRLGGRYEILKRVGGGGMAVVYQAKDLVLERHVAVKVMNDSISHDEEFIRRFNREAKAAGSLSHPNVVNVYDVGNEEHTHYMVMEFIDGQSLMEKIEQRGYIPAREAAEIALQICDGLAHAHENGIVHRDIKPHNIMVARGDRYKVADFGISRLSSSSTITQTGSVMGSVHYFSPEQAQGHQISYQSDIYSLGIVLYEMVTGRLPFDGDEAIAIALKHLQEPVPDPREIVPDLPQSICDVIVQAMEKDVNYRYATVEEMAADLREVVESLPNTNSSSSPDPATSPERERKTPSSQQPLGSRNSEGGKRHNQRGSKKKKSKKKWLGLIVVLLLLPLLLIGFNALGNWIENIAIGGGTGTEENQTPDGSKEDEASPEEQPDEQDMDQPSNEDSRKNLNNSTSQVTKRNSNHDDFDDHDDENDEDQSTDHKIGGNAFRKVSVEGSDGEYNISVETDRPFRYEVIIVHVPSGANTYISNSVDKVEDGEVEFEVNIPESDMPEYGLIKLQMYSSSGDQFTRILEKRYN